MYWPVGVTHCSAVGDIGLPFKAKGFVASSFLTVACDRLGGRVDGGLALVVLVVGAVLVVLGRAALALTLVVVVVGALGAALGAVFVLCFGGLGCGGGCDLLFL